MKIALFISGRLTCYEYNLIPILNYLDSKYEINLFVSINGERDEYHINAEINLSKWLKKISYENYKVPDNFTENTHKSSLIQIVDNKRVPYTNLSCFFNDRKAYESIIEYSVANSEKYDVYCKIRPDIIFNNINNLNFQKPKYDTIYSCVPPCPIYFDRNGRGPICVSDAFAYGDEKSMDIYTKTYDNIIFLNEKMNGKYLINYELCLTESIFRMIFCGDGHNNLDDCKNLNYYSLVKDYLELESLYNNLKVNIEYFNCSYSLNSNRRSKDLIKNINPF